MRTGAMAAMLAALALAVGGCGGDDEGTAGARGDEITVEMAAQSGSGESGTATLTRLDDGRTRVVIAIDNGTPTPQPAHIHAGSCAKLDPQPKYALTSIVNGASETTVQASLDELRDKAFAINVHQSESDLATYVSCGDVGGKGGDDGSGSGGYRY